MPPPAFVPAAGVVQRKAFLGAAATSPLASARLARQPHRAAPTARIGIPFRGRNAATEAVAEAVIEVPAAPPSRIERATEWSRAHPVRAGMFVAMLFVYTKRAVEAWRNDETPNFFDDARKEAEKRAGIVPAAAERESGGRATPAAHETSEEAMDLLGNTARKFVIVGGKGGVGKTSTSCAVAAKFADKGQTTLIVSTDPAHSLSDAFDQRVGGGEPVPVVGIDNLYAQEIDPENTKQSFNLMGGSGGGGDGMMSELGDMGLDDLNSLFDKLPPGFDEAAALAEIVKLLEGDPAYQKFDRIVFDTAPTGHTLRLLSLPEFLNGFVGKIINMKSKFKGVMNQFKGMFGGQDVDMDESFNDMEELKRTMAKVRDLFTDERRTEFIVTTIPNMMAIAESKRLVEELRGEQIPVRHLFVNQVQPENDDCTFCSVRHKEQSSNLKYIRSEFPQLKISTVQIFDREIRGAPALRAMGSQLFPGVDADVPTSGLNGSSGGAKTVIRPPSSTTTIPTVEAEIVE